MLIISEELSTKKLIPPFYLHLKILYRKFVNIHDIMMKNAILD